MFLYRNITIYYFKKEIKYNFTYYNKMNTVLTFYNNLVNIAGNNTINRRKFAVLRLAVSPNNNNLYSQYEEQINKHNNEMMTNPFPNSGFDLFTPGTVTFDKEIQSKFIDLQVKAEMIYCDMDTNYIEYSGYLVHPRSSISKTPLMLANHTGIIDSGYRGSLIGAFRWLGENNASSYTVEPMTRLLQICHPTLCPIIIELVDEDQLTNTERGAGGFGSTGK
jgi:dUTP pyrophosphatase